MGYAYVGPFHDRPAYDWAVETSIYVDERKIHKGVGGKLHDALEQVLKTQGILNMNACIAWPDGEEDETLTKNSGEFHAHLGYRMVGEFQKCGYKFHRWYNMIWMEKIIGEHADEQPSPIPIFSVGGHPFLIKILNSLFCPVFLDNRLRHSNRKTVRDHVRSSQQSLLQARCFLYILQTWQFCVGNPQ